MAPGQKLQEFNDSVRIFTGNAHPALAQEISAKLNIPLSPGVVSRFKDGESQVELSDSVRERVVFIIQPLFSLFMSQADCFFELCVMVDAAVRASAKRVVAVIPYFAFARQDRKSAPRTPITAKLAADFLQVAGVNDVILFELHAPQIQAYFNKPVKVNHLYFSTLFVPYLRENYGSLSNTNIISPDAGGVQRVRAWTKRLGMELGIIIKMRGGASQIESMVFYGDVMDRGCIILDDMTSTGSTLKQGAEVLLQKGAKWVDAFIGHAPLAPGALDIINNSSLRRVVFTDSVPMSEEIRACQKITQLPSADVFAQAIANTFTGDPFSDVNIIPHF